MGFFDKQEEVVAAGKDCAADAIKFFGNTLKKVDLIDNSRLSNVNKSDAIIGLATNLATVKFAECEGVLPPLPTGANSGSGKVR